MRYASNYYRTIGTGLAIFFSASLFASAAESAVPSALSKWLSNRAVPELRELLEQHPLYQDQRIAIVAIENDGLSEALATILRINLENRAGISLWQPQAASPAGVGVGVPASIDALDCNSPADFDFTLQVAAARSRGDRGEVSIRLVPVEQAEQTGDNWAWKGKFNQAEQEYIDRAAESSPADGSLAAPWQKEEVETAARRLSREFACALRPQVRTHLALQWAEQSGLPGLFADTINASRHLIGNYRELAHSGADADYEVSVELQRFGEDTWQLWLIGTPRKTALRPVQAVTYFRVADQEWPVLAKTGSASTRGYSLPIGDAVDFIDVEMLDATQSDRGRTSADLEVTVRIANRADWALEYSFSLSGGHFNHCIADPAYYRHDGYGQVEGRIDAGDSVVRRLLISGTEHRPTPVFGTRKCAGFRDLDGFEDFADQGYKVTDFVRWDTSGGMTK
jgi:hypothetical protein